MLSLRSLSFLLLPPLLWAGNAVVGRSMAQTISPMMLNALRWLLAWLILSCLLRQGRLSLVQWRQHWRWLALLSLSGVGLYNSLQYLALHSTTATNVTLMAASMPFWMMLTGRLFFKTVWSGAQLAGAGLSLVGVVVVLSHGEFIHIAQFKWQAGDFYMLLAAASWSCYSWLLTRSPVFANTTALGLLQAQLGAGLIWCAVLASAEALMGYSYLRVNPQLLGSIAFVALGPSLLAYRCWGLAVAEVGPTRAALFANFTPLFAALLSASLFAEALHAYQILAFACLLAGVVVSGRAQAKV